MRFDDSLKTILSADMQKGVGAQSAWRQLVDLTSRGRIPADDVILARLRLLRQAVPADVRAASARAVAFATPGAALVGLFAEDAPRIAAPVLRTAVLPPGDWLAMLPRMTPEGRSILRHRRDLPSEVVRGLASFGATDFVLGDDTSSVDSGPSGVTDDAEAESHDSAIPAAPPWDTPLSETPFVTLGEVARGLPLIAEARRREEAEPTGAGGFRIADLVARIDAFQKSRDEEPARSPEPAAAFRYETDRDGTIRWVEGVARGALVGVSFAHPTCQGVTAVDAVMTGALRHRARFADARLEVGGTTDAAGSWRLAGEPMFDHATGRFVGMRGVARRIGTAPSANDGAVGNRRADSLRQLVHELRTPTNAIAGFAELIETQLLGPVTSSYRGYAATIHDQATRLIAAIDDLDIAARIDGGALEQRPTKLALAPIVAAAIDGLAPLTKDRAAQVTSDIAPDLGTTADDRLVERLMSRLIGALVAAAAPDEPIMVAGRRHGAAASLDLTRPRAFGDRDATALFGIDADTESDGAASLLGIGFALRLSRNLARELGGELCFAADRLTLRLPAAVDERVGQAVD